MQTVHFIYPHRDRISCPDAIGRKVGQRLQQRYRVKYYNWHQFQKIDPEPGDVLLGHACPIPFTIFRRSCRSKKWGRVILFSPHCHGDDWQPAFNDRILPRCDLYLAITGPYWFADVPHSGFAHWLPKMRHIDLAVDQQDFPVIKRSFAEPGKRRFLYIGSRAWYKNVDYLAALSERLPAGSISWIGVDDAPGRIRPLGRHDFRSQASQELIAEHDFLLTVGRADGNPTTILEAMAWGLIPVCTKQSGYSGISSIPNIALDDADRATADLTELLHRPTSELIPLQAANWKLLNQHYHWDRVSDQVIDAIESDACPDVSAPALRRTVQIRWAELSNPFWLSLIDPKKITRILRSSKA